MDLPKEITEQFTVGELLSCREKSVTLELVLKDTFSNEKNYNAKKNQYLLKVIPSAYYHKNLFIFVKEEKMLSCFFLKKELYRNDLFYQVYSQKITETEKKTIPLLVLVILCFVLFLYSFSLNLFVTKKHTPINVSSFADNPSTSAPSSSLITAFPSPPSTQTTSFPSPSCAETNTHANNIIDITGRGYQEKDFLNIKSDNSRIHMLFANQNKFARISILDEFSSLEEIYLDENKISSLKGIESLNHCKILILSHNRIKDLSPLKSLVSLEILDLSWNNQLQNISSLSRLSHLHTLLLTNTNISKIEIQSLQKALPNCTIYY